MTILNFKKGGLLWSDMNQLEHGILDNTSKLKFFETFPKRRLT